MATTQPTNQKRQRQRHSDKNSCLKIFLNRHRQSVDFLCALLLICLCLIVLLPQVHDSFIGDHDHDHTLEPETPSDDTQAEELSGPIMAQLPSGPDMTNALAVNLIESTTDNNNNNNNNTPTKQLDPSPDDQPDHDHSHHHHHHGFAAGEFLVCIGFFVFYCVGFFLERDPMEVEGTIVVSNKMGLRTQTTLPRASTSTCCSSTRRPSIQQATTSTANEQQQQQQEPVQVLSNNRTVANGDEVIDELTLLAPRFSFSRNVDDDCLMLLNPHHQHHTHNNHQSDTAQMTTSLSTSTVIEQQIRQTNNYGSTNQNEARSNSRHHDGSDSESDHLEAKATNSKRQKTTIVVDEIRIISEPCDTSTYVKLTWPRSIKMLLVSLILVAFLVFINIEVMGMYLAIKVFRACSTGALIYVAFFIMMPKDRAGCNSCEEEEI